MSTGCLDELLTYAIISIKLGISISLIVVGSIYHVLINKHYDLVIDDYNIASKIAISVGVVAFPSGYLVYRLSSYAVTSKINAKTWILVYCSFMLALYVSLLMVGIYEYRRITEKELKDRFISKINTTFIEAYYEKDLDITTQFFKVQSVNHCCGIYDVNDYPNKGRLPASCCYECKNCWEQFCSNKDEYWQEGCGNIMYDFTYDYTTTISIVNMAISSVGIFIMLLIPFWVDFHQFPSNSRATERPGYL